MRCQSCSSWILIRISCWSPVILRRILRSAECIRKRLRRLRVWIDRIKSWRGLLKSERLSLKILSMSKKNCKKTSHSNWSEWIRDCKKSRKKRSRSFRILRINSESKNFIRKRKWNESHLITYELWKRSKFWFMDLLKHSKIQWVMQAFELITCFYNWIKKRLMVEPWFQHSKLRRNIKRNEARRCLKSKISSCILKSKRLRKLLMHRLSLRNKKLLVFKALSQLIKKVKQKKFKKRKKS